jgi:hypothetical protein
MEVFLDLFDVVADDSVPFVALLAVNFDTNLRFGRSSRLVVLQFFG